MAITNWSHPHDTYTMNDNTFVTINNTVNIGDILFQPFVSSKGIDSKILTFDDYNEVLDNYGDPNMNLFGQAYYHVLNWLENGGIVKGIRLTAKNAVKSNAILMLNINIVETQKQDAAGNPLYKDAITGEETTVSTGNDRIMVKKAIVSHTIKTSSSIPAAKLDIQTLLRKEMVTDSDGLHVPLACFISKGKGVYGDMYRFRFAPATQREKDSKFRIHYLELYKNESGLERVSGTPVFVSSNPVAKNSANVSDYIEDVAERENYPVDVYSIEDAFYRAADTLLPVLQQYDSTITENDIDLYFFRDRKQNTYQGIEFASDTVDLGILTGIGLQSGSDGDFARSNPNRWDAINDRYQDLFLGKVDPSINDRREHKFRLTLDAGFPLEVKKAMVTWRNADNRDDHMLILDATNIYTVAGVKEYLTTEMTPDSNAIVIETQNFDTYDKYTGKNITVTSTYLWSCLFIKHIMTTGAHVPFAGVDIPLNAYIIEGSLRPVIAEPADKTAIYNLRGNYIEKENGNYIFGTNITSQLGTSELSYENNMFTYYEIKEDLRSLSSVFRFKFIESSDDMNLLNKLAQEKINKYKESKCKAIEVQVVKDDTDPYEKTVKTICNVGFNDFDLNNKIEVNIENY